MIKEEERHVAVEEGKEWTGQGWGARGCHEMGIPPYNVLVWG